MINWRKLLCLILDHKWSPWSRGENAQMDYRTCGRCHEREWKRVI